MKRIRGVSKIFCRKVNGVARCQSLLRAHAIAKRAVMRIPLWIVFSAALVLATASSQAKEEHFVLQRGKQTVYAMPNAPRMERFWLNATLDKSQGKLTAVWGYEKGGGQDGATISMTKQGDEWVGKGSNWAGNAVEFQITKDSVIYQWGPRLDGSGSNSMLGQIIWSAR
jgi:hypothetical protein